jgi:hypothetical protein
LVVAEYLAIGSQGHTAAPQKGHAKLVRTLHQLCVQDSSAKTHAKAPGERGFYARLAIRVMKTNSAEGHSFINADGDTQHFHRGQGVRHQTFAAGFIDGGTIMIRHGHAQSLLRGQNGSGEASRTASDDEHIRRMCTEGHSSLLPAITNGKQDSLDQSEERRVGSEFQNCAG